MRKPANEGWAAPPNTPADTSSKINPQSHQNPSAVTPHWRNNRPLSHHTDKQTALNLIRRHLLEGFLQCGFAIDHELQAAIPQSAHAVLHGEGLNFTRSSFLHHGFAHRLGADKQLVDGSSSAEPGIATG